MTAYVKAIIAAVLFALGLSVGWGTQGWRKNAELAEAHVSNATILRDIAEKTAKTVQAVARAGQLANAAIQQADEAATQRISNAKAETDRLRACVAAGTCGVRIVTRYVRESGSAGAANPSTSTMGDAALELDREAASRVLDLRESIQLDAEKLDYLRRYAETCWRTGSEAVKVVKETP